MKKSIIKSVILALAYLSVTVGIFPSDANAEKDSSLSTKWYLNYENGEKDGKDNSKFSINRAYLTFKPGVNDWFEPRITLDAHMDDEGDFEVRLKYLYGKFKLGGLSNLITDTAVEFGLVHTPWLDFEQKINAYRMKDKMTIERCGVQNSADAGITVFANLGGKLSKGAQSAVGNKKYAGKFGSVALGIYNGGGYHAKEKNNNKTFQSRVTVRPLSNWLPHLQLSYFHINGRGNKEDSPLWRTDNLMVSLQSNNIIATAQHFRGNGNQKGKMRKYKGYGAFVELKRDSWSLIGRHDWLRHKGEVAKKYWLGGIAHYFVGKNAVLLTYDCDTVSDDWKVVATVQIATKHVL